MAVCEFCRAVVHKDADAVRELGKVAAVLEDYSRIQLGTSGRHGERGFTVIGRIQLRYDAGIWNEWYLLFDDGGAGWLGDASGQYTLTEERPLEVEVPAFNELKPGSRHRLGRESGMFTVADKRSAASSGAQGELPFGLDQSWTARVVDLRREAQFATLDYSNGERPLLYGGAAVTLEGLQCQLLRDDEQIRASAGRYRARVDSLQCPNCGAAIGYLPGLAANLVCQACATRLDAATPQARVLAAGERHRERKFTLALGLEATIGAHQYRLLGVLVREDDDGEAWNEYLLYSTAGGFFWLVESSDGWWRSDLLDDWPEPAVPTEARVRHRKFTFEKTLNYPARITYAAGAFNWQARVGDVVQVREHQHGQVSLSAESNGQELTWSRSSPVADDQVRSWFKLPDFPGKATTSAQVDVQWLFVICLVFLNVVPLIFRTWSTLVWLLVGIAVLLFPPSIVNKD